ncbi:MAG TPA: hypothetical protein VMT53_10095, partial [Terriglobales bacterium]|nr:hypothetical protein [Terriglobales bacterium]
PSGRGTATAKVANSPTIRTPILIAVFMVVLLVVVQTLAPERAWACTATHYTAALKSFDNKIPLRPPLTSQSGKQARNLIVYFHLLRMVPKGRQALF